MRVHACATINTTVPQTITSSITSCAPNHHFLLINTASPRHPQSNPQPSTLNPQPSTLNPQPSTRLSRLNPPLYRNTLLPPNP
jgi:hypothetical protein